MRALMLMLLIGACSGDKGDPAGDTDEEVKPDPRTLVEVASVAKSSVGSHLVASATVESEAQAALVPETSGVVTGLYAEEGDAVQKGSLLAIIASPQLDAAYQRASTELDRATNDADAADRLYAQGAISKSELTLAKQGLAVARTAHEEASATRGFTRLESPIDGTVATRSVHYGELTGMTPAFTIVDLTRLRVIVNLPERDLMRVRKDLPAELVSAYDDKVKGAGTVLRIAPVVDPMSGTFRTTVSLAPDSPLRPGQFVSVRIEVDRHEGVLTVPRRALVWEEGKAYVYRIGDAPPDEPEDGKEKKEEGGFSFDFKLPWDTDEEKKDEELPGPRRAAFRAPVQVGFQDGEVAELLGGVVEGDQVVIVGNAALRDAARVRLPGDPTVASAVAAETDAAPAATP